MNCLITGGAGFIGSNLAEYLLARGWTVRILDNLSTGRRVNLAAFERRVEFIEGDIRDRELVGRAAAGCRVIFHQAALPSVPRSVKDPALTNEVNVTGTLNVLLAAREAGAERVVLASSSSIYGDNPEMPRREELTPRPLSPYAVSKLACEHYARAFAVVYGLQTVALRYFNVFGPRQDPDSPYSAVIPRFIRALQQGQRPQVYGDGRQSRDFTYIEQVCRVNELAATVAGPFHGEAFNVGCGRRFSLLELLGELGRIIGRVPEPEFLPERAGDARHSQAAIDKLRQVLDFEPRADFPAELARTVEWFGREGAAANA